MTEKEILHTGDIEKYGTGFKRIHDWLKDYPNISYEFIDLMSFIKLKIKTSANVPLNVLLNERQKKILGLIKTNRNMTTMDIQITNPPKQTTTHKHLPRNF